MLNDDQVRHEKFAKQGEKERFVTTKMSQFDATVEQPLARDRRWDRITEHTPRECNMQLASSTSGLFERQRRMKGHRFKDSMKKTRLGKNYLDNQLSYHECLPRDDTVSYTHLTLPTILRV